MSGIGSQLFSAGFNGIKTLSPSRMIVHALMLLQAASALVPDASTQGSIRPGYMFAGDSFQSPDGFHNFTFWRSSEATVSDVNGTVIWSIGKPGPDADYFLVINMGAAHICQPDGLVLSTFGEKSSEKGLYALELHNGGLLTINGPNGVTWKSK
ncbi:MAG: hypothetical protein J3Q66DRAFT_374681 [Benniella sp.]|nr:MAG: hypothetical protein J3Q66DRAFT_374681 [Benniella sp.]